jgi:hypothetical protein
VRRWKKRKIEKGGRFDGLAVPKIKLTLDVGGHYP